MLGCMNQPPSPFSPEELNAEITDIELGSSRGLRRRRRRWWLILFGMLALTFFFAPRFISIYVDALWYNSLGFSAVYWTALKYQVVLFLIFAILTTLILRSAFLLFDHIFAASLRSPRHVLLNNQPVEIAPARILKPLGWIVTLLFGIGWGFGMSSQWTQFALWLNRSQTSEFDPIFNQPLGFYLFLLPGLNGISSWLLILSFIVLAAAVLYTLLDRTHPAKGLGGTGASPIRSASYAGLSYALAFFFVALAARIYFARYGYLFDDHQTFSGVNYTEANYLLPALVGVAIALLLAAVILLYGAFTRHGFKYIVVACAIPVAVYVIGGMLIPGYVNSFIVKPNELDRETPYIEHNIRATQRAFNLEGIHSRDFAAETTPAAFDLPNNHPTLDNLRLWDYRALQDTLKQVQEIRTYYDFNDVDVDRYPIGGQIRQVMLAAREMDISKLPASTRGNWINERLVFTHGYGITMNTANGFTAEGRPQFILSNMPAESSAPDIKLTRPQIYFGEKTDTTVYVKTKQKEFDYPQGDANASIVYDGTGGFPVGSGLRRWLIAYELDDLTKLPFSDDVTPESRVLMHRQIKQRIERLAPFLSYDDDPYIVVGDDGRLSWIIDAYASTADYPYSRHYNVGNSAVNYIRNSVKVVVDAYDGSVQFYVFDSQDPLIQAYRNVFPVLFRDAAQMPADLRNHVRYPETLLRAQADAYGLYHTEDAKTFFQREDVWSVAQEVSPGDNRSQEARPLEPYFMLLQFPEMAASSESHNSVQNAAANRDETQENVEFVNIVPFTPGARNNLIGWMAGRSDGDKYGSLLVYKFPKSKLVDGPLQIEARIDQNAQLSGQLTLWNQQGSHVQRGNLLVIPLGRGLLYVEPIYLQAANSPMPELRLVVLATQERLAYGTSFAEALVGLFGEAAAGDVVRHSPASQPDSSLDSSNKSDLDTQPRQSAVQPAEAQANIKNLAKRAAADFDAYQRLTAEGKLGEAGQKLEALKRDLEELQKENGQ